LIGRYVQNVLESLEVMDFSRICILFEDLVKYFEERMPGSTPCIHGIGEIEEEGLSEFISLAGRHLERNIFKVIFVLII
jgi:hypothetical protein